MGVIHFGEKGKSMSTGPAILLSIGLFLLCVVIEAITGLRYIIISTMVFGTALWAGVDAYRIELKKYKTLGIEYGAFGAFAAVLALWIIGFPWYLSMRGKILRGQAELRDKYKEEAIKSISLVENNYDEILAQLEKLGELKEKGILTDEEFRAQKEKLLSS